MAEVTDDLEDRREEIKRYLKDQGFRVLPEENGYLTYDATNLQQNINTNSTASLLYVQLVSRLRGKKILGADSCITKFQYDNVKPAGKKILLWRSPDLKMDEADMPIELKELHSSEHIRAECFEDFKTAVLQMLTIKNEEDPVEPDNRFVYICTDSIDKPYCDTKIVPRLERKNIDYSYPLLNSKDITRVRKFQDQNLLSCDAALFVYCSSDPDTVFNQLMYCRKIKTSRKLPFKIVAIYDGPPPEKEAIELGIQSIPYSYLNCRENDKYIVI